MQVFFDTYSQYIIPSDTLVLAISGWVDSMVLFDMMKEHHPRERIIVAHFDHCLRWAESDWDRELVASICNSENITFEVQKMNIAQIASNEKSSLEAIARRERYRFLESIRAKYDARYILTAHHRDDQAETILMNLIKGAKVRWLSGMSTLSGYVFRPLLGIAKAEILQYAWEKTTAYREDSTNQDTDYTRNNIRHNIVPLLHSINPSVDETLSDLGWYMQELWIFLSGYIDNWLQGAEKISWRDQSFLISEFVLLEEFIKREVVSTLYARAHDDSTQWLSRGMIAEIIRFITEGSNSHGTKEIKKLRLERKGERVYY